MSTREELLSAVIASPDDDGPRLRFAEFCERQGDAERAEFIRVQCELSAGRADGARRVDLQQRERQLLADRGWDWAEEFGTEVTEWVFGRGFVERVGMSLEAPAEQILATARKSPIRHLRDTGQFCDLSGFVAALPHVGTLTGLEFWGLYAFEDALLRQLLESPHLSELRTLILHHDRNGNLADERVIIDALNSPCRAKVEELAVNVDGSWRGPSNAILAAVAGSPHLRRLHKLTISHAGDTGNNPELDPYTVRLLASSPNLAAVRELDLRGTMTTADGWKEVLAMPQLPSLQKLYLSGAAEVRTPWVPIVGWLSKLPHWRAEFEKKVGPSCSLDWATDFIDPYNGGVWRGMSWEERKQKALFAMAPFIRRRDSDALERDYHALCRQTAGEALATAIAALPFDRWQDGIRPVLVEVLKIAERRRSARVVLRLRPDINWTGQFGLHDPHDPQANPGADLGVKGTESDEPFAEYSYSTPEVTRDTTPFQEAADLFKAHPLGAGTRPSGPALYLIARTVAAFGKCLEGLHSPCPLFISFMCGVFRME